jgi:nucleoside-diphosphate-sugar epimerase/lipopolysaccharide/colanic/teichoic acid biosynthesis glycosyltransferase
MRGRILQLAIACIAIVVVFPLMLVLAVASAFAFRAFPLFMQPRVGRNGRVFNMWKIRSLPADTAPNVSKYELTPATPGRFGRVLRRTHVDELPQLFLVVTGRMALVGPRPEMPTMANAFSESFATTRERVRPGCTGLWQLSPASRGLINEAPEYDTYYVEHATARLDLWILWRTFVQFVRPRAYVGLDDIPRWTGARSHGQAADVPGVVELDRDEVVLSSIADAISRPVAADSDDPARRLAGPVLVCGAGGFIGGHMVRRLVDAGMAVRAVDLKPLDEWFQHHAGVEEIQADLSEIDACHRVMQGMRSVINLAADMGGMGFIENNKALCMLSVLINTHLLMAAKEERVDRYFYASSACVYRADKQKSPEVTALAEEDAYPASPEDGYGWEKLFSERMCRHFREDFGVPTRVARLHNVYGPNGSYDGGREKAPAAISRKVAESVLFGRTTIDIWGDGQQTRSFTYVDDCVEGILRLTTSDVFEPINIGSSELVSIEHLVEIVEDIAGVELEREYQLHAPQGVRGRNSDNARILRVLGWEPSTSLRTGLEHTYGWVYEQLKVKADARSGV